MTPPTAVPNWSIIGDTRVVWFIDILSMTSIARKVALAIVGAALLTILSEDAYALRCGSKLILDGMHEAEVRRLCGDPVSVRQLGYVIRAYRNPGRAVAGRDSSTYYSYGYGYHHELMVVELIFNFGPRKLMRAMRFEGGRLTSISTAGYGFLQDGD